MLILFKQNLTKIKKERGKKQPTISETEIIQAYWSHVFLSVQSWMIPDFLYTLYAM